jgi:hypothetical protein
MSIHKLLSYFSEFYFTNFFLIVITIFFLIYGAFHYRKLNELNIVLLYGLFSLIQSILSYYVLFIIPNDYNFIIEYSINIFLLVEFLLFYLLFFLIIKSKYIKYILVLLTFIFLCIIFYHWTYTNELYKNPARLTVIECFFLIIPSLYYFIEIFYYSPITNLLKEPHFWIVTGIMFFFTSIFPLFLLNIFVLYPRASFYNSMYSITYISYCLLFVMFFIGCKCKIKKISSL